jgi:multidrug resistance efflux pump
VTARVGALALVVACSGAPPADRAGDRQARDAIAHTGDVRDRVLLTGELQPEPTSALKLQVPRVDDGVGIRFLAEDGAPVKAGDKLLELDNSAFTQNLEQKHITALEAETAWHDSEDLTQIALADKANELRQRQLDRDKAELAASVPADLVSPHDAQQRKLDLMRAETAVAKAQRDLAAERDGDALERHVKQLDRDRADEVVATAEQTIAALVIAAPRDGVFVVADQPWEGRKFQVGDTVWQGLTVGSMPDVTRPLEVDADLSDVDDGKVAVGMTGTCTLDAYPAAPEPCTVQRVAPVARDSNKKSLRRGFAVVVGLDRGNTTRQRPGLSVKVELAGAPVHGVVVPRGAVVFGDATQVRMASGELRAVDVAGCSAQACAIARGVSDGEAVRP